jgi:murein DD-endopeptidase MepM/ murein hydrolase activator NlpD
MHRKTSTATERLIALRALIVGFATRTGVAAVQILVATVALVRALPVTAVQALAATPELARTVRASGVRAAAHSLLRNRQAMAGLGYAAVLALMIVGGTAALVQNESPAPPTVAVADSEDRLAAAERADRSARTAAPDVAADPAAAAAESAAVAPPTPPPAWVAPMANIPLSSCYGPRWGSMHRGLDFAGESGTPILAVGAGTVFGAGWLYGGYGQSVVIDHGNGYFTHYAHALATNVVVGQQVKAGDLIAWEGSTGDSTGPHLHFEVHQGLWNQINPAQFLRERGVQVGC